MKFLKWVISFSFVLFLAACGSASGSESPKESILEDKPDVVLEKSTGVFIGKFENEFIDVEVDGTKKMYRYVSDMQKIVDVLEQNEKISIAFEKTKEGEQVIHLITRLNPVASVKDEEKDKEEEEKVVEDEDEEEEDASNDDFTLSLGSNFELSGNTVSYKEDKGVYAVIEILPFDTEIKKERWRAAPILKEVGKLKEIHDNYIPGTSFEKAEFIFAGYGEDFTQYIAVKWIDETLYRFTVNVPFKDGYESIETELWNSLVTIESN